MDKLINFIVTILPTVITSIAVFYLTRRQNKRDKETENHTTAQQKEAMLNMKLAIATLKLSEANAIALRDGRTNGETKAAMAECEAAKKAYYEFLNAQAYEHIT